MALPALGCTKDANFHCVSREYGAEMTHSVDVICQVDLRNYCRPDELHPYLC